MTTVTNFWAYLQEKLGVGVPARGIVQSYPSGTGPLQEIVRGLDAFLFAKSLHAALPSSPTTQRGGDCAEDILGSISKHTYRTKNFMEISQCCQFIVPMYINFEQ